MASLRAGCARICVLEHWPADQAARPHHAAVASLCHLCQMLRQRDSGSISSAITSTQPDMPTSWPCKCGCFATCGYHWASPRPSCAVCGIAAVVSQGIWIGAVAIEFLYGSIVVGTYVIVFGLYWWMAPCTAALTCFHGGIDTCCNTMSSHTSWH